MTIRTVAYLKSSEFQDAQAAGSITPADERDEIDTLAQKPFSVACSDETTNLTTGTAVLTWRMPYAMSVTDVRINCNTAPVGATIIVDVKKAGVSIFSTKVSIDAGERTSVTAATACVLTSNPLSLADDDEMTVNIDQVGSSTPGKGLKLTLIGSLA